MSDETTVKQYPYDLKAEQLQSGLWKLSCHVYGEDPVKVASQLALMLSEGEIQLERQGKPLLGYGPPILKEKPKAEVSKKK